MEPEKMENQGIEIVKHAGLTFNFNNMDYGATHGLKCFGHQLETIDFKDSATMQKRIDSLHEWGEGPVMSKRLYEKNGAENSILANAKEIYDVVTGEHFTTVTDKYNLVQNKPLFEAVLKTAQNRGIEPMGRIDVGEKGFTTGYVILADPGLEINILQQYEEPVMLMPEIRNSAAGQMGVTFGVAGIQAICSNYGLWGKQVGCKLSAKHSNDAVDQFADLIGIHLDNIIANTPAINKMCSDAESELISSKPGDIQLMLWGCKAGKGLPIKIIDAVVEDPTKYNVRLTDKSPVGKLEMSKFQLHNCVTNALTWYKMGGAQARLAEFEAANSLLTTKVDELIKIGTKRMESYAEQLEKQKAKAQKAKEVQTVKG